VTSGAAAEPASSAGLTRYRRSRLTVTRYIATRTLRTGALIGLVLGAFAYTAPAAFRIVGTTQTQRARVLNSITNSTGLRALLGATQRITGASGYLEWRVIGVAAIIGPIWGLLAATRLLRGEEMIGRWELFLAGPITMRRATANAMAGLAAGLVSMYIVAAAMTMLAGGSPGVGISPARGLLFGVAAVAASAEFLAIGALAGQLMSTRSEAAALAAAVFGAAFMLRALGDAAASVHWLVYPSPLGWIEQLQLLGRAQPLWLLPIAGLTAACCGLTVVLAGRRDLGESVLPGRSTAAPRTALLATPLRLAVRLSLPVTARWLGATVAVATLYGMGARSAGQAFASSASLISYAGALEHSARAATQDAGARLYAGVIFLLPMTLIMACAASSVGRLREEEALGYLDNLVVRPVSRQRWLGGRIGLIMAVIAMAGLLAGAGFWAGAASQHAGLTFGEMIQAGISAVAPAAALTGIGILVLGFAPRLALVACWGILSWAFLLDLIASPLKISHWIMDTSLLQHVPLVPAVSPNWRIWATYLAIFCAGAAIGGWRFTRRDLEGS
jgi:ABC-2 type transport system permease protein